jgi:hypothetical protein
MFGRDHVTTGATDDLRQVSNTQFTVKAWMGSPSVGFTSASLEPKKLACFFLGIQNNGTPMSWEAAEDLIFGRDHMTTGRQMTCTQVSNAQLTLKHAFSDHGSYSPLTQIYVKGLK